MDTTATATQPPAPTATTPLLPTLDKLASLSSTTNANATSLNEPITPPLPLTNLPPQHAHFFSSYMQMNGHPQHHHHHQPQQQQPINGQNFFFNNQIPYNPFTNHSTLGHVPLPSQQTPYSHSANEILFRNFNKTNQNVPQSQQNGVYTTPTLNTLLQQPTQQQQITQQPSVQAQPPTKATKSLANKKKKSANDSPRKKQPNVNANNNNNVNSNTNFAIINSSTNNSDAGSDSGDSRLVSVA
jgi:hypothetical protein